MVIDANIADLVIMVMLQEELHMIVDQLNQVSKYRFFFYKQLNILNLFLILKIVCEEREVCVPQPPSCPICPQPAPGS